VGVGIGSVVNDGLLIGGGIRVVSSPSEGGTNIYGNKSLMFDEEGMKKGRKYGIK